MTAEERPRLAVTRLHVAVGGRLKAECEVHTRDGMATCVDVVLIGHDGEPIRRVQSVSVDLDGICYTDTDGVEYRGIRSAKLLAHGQLIAESDEKGAIWQRWAPDDA